MGVVFFCIFLKVLMPVMRVSAYQPYLAPFPGFFEKALRSDLLVLMDCVQFPRGSTWLTRNRFKNDQGILWIKVPVWKKGLGLQRIRDVRICHEGRWMRKNLSSLKAAYSNSPFFEEHLPFIAYIFEKRWEWLVDLNVAVIRYLLERLEIETDCMLLSELDITDREPYLSLELCRKLGCSDFLAQNSARKYMDQELFRKEGVGLDFFRPSSPVYPQLWGDFIPNLSAFDLLFNCGPKAGGVLTSGQHRIAR